jgi:amino acid adenylation domain-containing protein
MNTGTTERLNYNLAQPFYESATKHPANLALFVGDRRFTYEQLANSARQIAGWLGRQPGAASGKVGILASRTVEAYAGILGTLWSGAAYVPINPHTPENRLIRILKMTNLDALIVDQAGLELLSRKVMECAPDRILIGSDGTPPQSVLEFDPSRFSNIAELPDEGPDRPVTAAEDALAYIIFTSGTTGTPKGVMIENGSVAQLVRVLQRRFDFRPDDRVSQIFELSFDASVFNLFMTWNSGAALYAVPVDQLLAPAKFLKENQLTVWFSVPTTALVMQRLRLLSSGVFPHLRFSLFVGEGLPLQLAQSWAAAAPNSSVQNLYGPTEATVVCTGQRLTEPPNATPNRGVLAIGDPFDGVDADVLDSTLNPLPATEIGELVVAGRQLARGYFNDPELTAARFPTLRGKRWYRTGDLAFRDESGSYHCLGRIDNQVKVLGNRVELEEIEAHLREIAGTDLVTAVAWPCGDNRATGIVAFHCAPGVTRDKVRNEMKKRVPDYMIPQRVHCLDALPLGPSGKVDRKALVRLLDEGKV